MNQKVYVGKNKKEAQPVHLLPLLKKLLSPIQRQGFTIQVGSFSDQSAAWIEISKRSNRNTLVTIVLSTDEDYDTVSSLNVYETPYKLDEDNEKKVI